MILKPLIFVINRLLVIVIARGHGFMAVNEPCLRAQPEDKVCLHCHKSMSTRATFCMSTHTHNSENT